MSHPANNGIAQVDRAAPVTSLPVSPEQSSVVAFFHFKITIREMGTSGEKASYYIIESLH